MTSARQSESPALDLSRKNTWQRMQELERQQRISRMSTASMTSATSLPLKTSSPDRARHQSLLISKSRPQEQPAPALSNATQETKSKPQLLISLPPSVTSQTQIDSSADGTPVVIMDDDAMSDASSICHSPSWSDYGSAKDKEKKKKKALKELEKQKKKQEKENQKLADKSAGSGFLKPKRLSKPPPTSRPGLMRRSVTAPAISALAELPEPSPSLVSSPFTEKRSDSFPSQISGAQMASSEESSSSGTGFVGGLKLQMLNDKSIQDAITKQRHPDNSQSSNKGLSSRAQNAAAYPTSVKSSQSRSSTQDDMSWLKTVYRDETILNSASSRPSSSGGHEEGSYAARIAKEAEQPTNHSKESTSDRASRTGRRHNSERYSIAGSYETAGGSNNMDAARREKIRAAVLADVLSAQSPARKKATQTVSPLETSSVASALPRIPGGADVQSESALPNSIGESANLFAGFEEISFESEHIESENEGVDDEDTYHNFITESVRNPVDVISSLPLVEKNSVKHVPPCTALTDSILQYKAPELTLGKKEPKNRFSLGRGSSFYAGSMFKSAAKSAFGMKSTTSVDNNNSGAQDSSTSRRLSSTTTMDSILPKGRPTSAKSCSKADRLLGESISPAPHRHVTQELPEVFGGSLSSASTTDQSDERSSLDAPSNITTPTVSRPQSRQPPLTRRKVDQSSQPQDDDIKEHQQIELNKTPNPKGSQTAVSDPVRRTPSITRSQSTPQLQEPTADLSFLPELKHQALRPVPPRALASDSFLTDEKRKIKGKGKEVSLVPVGPSSLTQEVSPISPASSTYLRDARLSLPKKGLHSQQQKQRRMSVGTSVKANGGSSPDEQPIAKMFVICCGCKFFHDLPSKIYEAMAKGPSVVQDMDLGVSGIIKTQVSCPWCGHGMSTDCCAGYATVVYLRERFH